MEGVPAAEELSVVEEFSVVGEFSVVEELSVAEELGAGGFDAEVFDARGLPAEEPDAEGFGVASTCSSPLEAEAEELDTCEPEVPTSLRARFGCACGDLENWRRLFRSANDTGPWCVLS